ncbi:MAG: hypothetical protein QW331_00495, partial [Candidatus Woesearchaeota archaeon]
SVSILGVANAAMTKVKIANLEKNIKVFHAREFGSSFFTNLNYLNIKNKVIKNAGTINSSKSGY